MTNPSFWALNAPLRDPGARIRGTGTADVVVIGGGFAGLSTSWHLKRLNPSLRVMLLEAETLGHGASGRNSGWVMPQLGLDASLVKRFFGAERARAALDYAYEACDYLESLVAEHSIACDYRRVGYTTTAVDPTGEQDLEAIEELFTRIGLGDRLEPVDGAWTSERFGSSFFLAGLRERAGALVDPFLLVREWGRLAEEAGVEIHEHSPVLGIRRDRASTTVSTPLASIRANQVAVATGAYTSQLEGLEPRLRRVSAFMSPWAATTTVLSDDRWGSIGFEHFDAVKTMLGLPHIFHRAPDGRMHLANERRVSFSRRPRDHDLGFAQDAERQLHAFYPDLRDVGIEYHWGGVCSITPDLVPRIGVTPGSRLGYAFGWNGHGVAVTQLAGRTLAQLLVGDDSADHPWFVNRLGIPWPTPWAAPVGMGAAVRAYMAMDRHRLRGLPIA